MDPWTTKFELWGSTYLHTFSLKIVNTIGLHSPWLVASMDQGHRELTINYRRANTCVVHRLTLYHELYSKNNISPMKLNIENISFLEDWVLDFILFSLAPLLRWVWWKLFRWMSANSPVYSGSWYQKRHLYKVGKRRINQAHDLTSSTRASPFFNHR